jgi:hypothetical protein
MTVRVETRAESLIGGCIRFVPRTDGCGEAN